MVEKVPFTLEGYTRLKEELRQLTSVERPKIIKAIEEARAHGDLSENAEYHAAKEKQSFLEGRILELNDILSRAEVVEPDNRDNNRVVFGKTVVVYDINEDREVTYKLVGPYESDPDKGFISIASPIGQAILGRRPGDEVKVATPGGTKEYEILEIQ
jgi:transcription elongation factor GreA